MPGQGRKRADGDVAPLIGGEIVPATLEELDEPAGREGDDELEDGDAAEMNEAGEDEADDDEDDEADEDEADDDEDEEDEEDDDR
jgi:hypothetical protein